MQLEKQFKIEKVMSKDPTRPSLNSGYIEENGPSASKLIATDGHKLACIPFVAGGVEKNNPDNLRVSADAVRAMRRNGGHGTVREKKLLVGDVEYLMTDESASQFPDYKQMIPDSDKCRHHTITLNPKFLMDLAAAIGGGRRVTLHLPADPLDPIRVTTSDEPGALGVLMPMRNPK